MHIHTLASDGHIDPKEAVRYAEKHNLEVISITDHDTIKGYQEATEEAEKRDIKLLPGIEITSDFKDRECHLLAYCFDPNHSAIKKLVWHHYQSRLKRGSWIIEQLRNQGMELDLEEVKAEARGGNIGRPHIAAVLENKGYVASFKEAFIRYLSDDQLGNIYNEYYSHHQVIDIIREAGGAVVIAHPGRLYSEEELESLVEAGVDGIEVIHPSHNYQTQKQMEEFADRHNLLKTGGSDFHGSNKKYQKYFGVVTINTKYVYRLLRLTNQRKETIA
nr:PHP domain-containing protein [Fodinibius salicampi]